MAAIRKRGTKWQVQVRKKNSGLVTRTFTLKADAEAWARQKEVEADRGSLPVDPKQLETTSFGQLIDRYRETVTSQKRGQSEEAIRLKCMRRHSMAELALSKLAPSTFADYRDERLQHVSTGTVRHELSLMQNVIEIARKEWAICLPENPVAKIRKPQPNRARNRRLGPGELDRLIAATAKCRNKLVQPFFRFAIETGMRRGEILKLGWDDVDLARRTLHIPETKNGHPRTIPLTSAAVEILASVDTRDGERVFPLTVEAIKLAWKRLVKRADVPDLHFHDLRHEAVSRFFEKGLSVPEVALISGHRDYRQLQRYTHLRPEDLVGKIG